MRVTAGRHVFIWLALALAPAFAVTALVAGAHKSMQRNLAIEWQARGEAALASHDPARAIDALRNALIYDRDNRLTRLRLAQALRAAGRTPEARAHLVTLWEDQPGNGPVNLELARLAAAEHDRPAALRHYHDAIEGAWPANPEQRRRDAQIELAEFLLRERAVPQAQAELIPLAADLPDDVMVRKQVASLLLRADLPDRALRVYEALAARSGTDAESLAGAGRAAYTLGNDSLAVRYFSRAIGQGTRDADVPPMLETARLALTADPFARRLSTGERLSRAVRALESAAARLQCPAIPEAERQPLLGEIGFARQVTTPAALRAQPEAIEDALDVVLRAERTAGDRCPAQPLDRALVRILERRQKGDG